MIKSDAADLTRFDLVDTRKHLEFLIYVLIGDKQLFGYLYALLDVNINPKLLVYNYSLKIITTQTMW